MIFALAIVALAVAASQDSVSTQPTTRLSPTSQQRQSDLIAIIEGQNSPEARRTAARELLLQNWPETAPRLVAILGTNAAPARIAVAAALTDLPQYLEAIYIEPLLAMLADADLDVRTAGATTLAAFNAELIVPRLSAAARDPSRPTAARVAAAAALGSMTSHSSVAALVTLLDDPAEPVRAAALQSLELAMAMEFNGSTSAAIDWWESIADMSLVDWQQRQIERLVRVDRANDRKLQQLEARLNRTLRESYLRTPEAERAAALQGFLADQTPSVKRLGLELIRAQVEEGKPPTPELATAARSLLNDADSAVSALAIRTVASLRDPSDADRFIELLGASDRREVKQSLTNALGYIGGPSAVPVLVGILDRREEKCLKEAVGAIGRLAERGIIARGDEAVISAMLSIFREFRTSDNELRTRLIWGLGLVGDDRVIPVLRTALATSQPADIRQAAARAISGFDQPSLADELLPLTTDPDAGVRRAGVEALAILGAADPHLLALWGRIAPPQELDEGIRAAAWRGVVRILGKQPALSIEQWSERLPDGLPDREQRRIELLQLQEQALSANGSSPAELGDMRLRIADALVKLGAHADAVPWLRKAVTTLATARSANSRRARIELLKASLIAGLYNHDIATAVATGDPRLESTDAWHEVRVMIEELLAGRGSERAQRALELFSEFPPSDFSPQALQEIADLLGRVKKQRESEAAPAVGSQPTTQTAER